MNYSHIVLHLSIYRLDSEISDDSTDPLAQSIKMMVPSKLIINFTQSESCERDHNTVRRFLKSLIRL